LIPIWERLPLRNPSNQPTKKPKALNTLGFSKRLKVLALQEVNGTSLVTFNGKESIAGLQELIESRTCDICRDK
jgi:hypothetical protein